MRFLPHERQSDVSIMKKILFFIFSVLLSHTIYAQFNGDGFYRIQNASTDRYLTIVDNRASVNLATTNPDLAAILPIRNIENIVGNPGSVIYIHKASSNDYTLRAQGIDSYDVMGLYLHLRPLSDGSYYAYATAKGLTKFLYDEASDYDEGWLMTTGTEATKKWEIIPLNSSSNNYFAAVPEFEHNGSHYTTMYAAFPFKPVNGNVSLFYISLVKDGVAVIKEVTDGFVPAATPVIVKCASANYTDNRFDVFTSGGSAVSGNCLSGVYFNNSNKKHENRVKYDPSTMRVLGTMSDGSLGFITADIEYLPANKAYLKVPAASAKEIRIITENEYETSIENTLSHETVSTMYYDLSGRRIATPSKGLYLTSKGKKVFK